MLNPDGTAFNTPDFKDDGIHDDKFRDPSSDHNGMKGAGNDSPFGASVSGGPMDSMPALGVKNPGHSSSHYYFTIGYERDVIS